MSPNNPVPKKTTPKPISKVATKTRVSFENLFLSPRTYWKQSNPWKPKASNYPNEITLIILTPYLIVPSHPEGISVRFRKEAIARKHEAGFLLWCIWDEAHPSKVNLLALSYNGFISPIVACCLSIFPSYMKKWLSFFRFVSKGIVTCVMLPLLRWSKWSQPDTRYSSSFIRATCPLLWLEPDQETEPFWQPDRPWDTIPFGANDR